MPNILSIQAVYPTFISVNQAQWRPYIILVLFWQKLVFGMLRPFVTGSLTETVNIQPRLYD